MSKKADREAARQEALAKLREILPPGSEVTCVLRHVSRSGMLREIDFYHFAPDGVKHWLSGYMSTALDYPRGRHAGRDGLRVSGCGMDMGFSVVYNLSSALYPDGFGCLGKTDQPWFYCPSNDHSNGDRDYTPGDQHWHKTGGYAIRSTWL